VADFQANGHKQHASVIALQSSCLAECRLRSCLLGWNKQFAIAISLDSTNFIPEGDFRRLGHKFLDPGKDRLKIGLGEVLVPIARGFASSRERESTFYLFGIGAGRS